MICATTQKLPNNAILANVIIDCKAHKPVVLSKIFTDENMMAKWQCQETGRQMLDIIRCYVNQRDRAISMTRGLSITEGEAVVKLQILVGGSVNMHEVAKRIVFYEKELWVLAPSNNSRFAGWRETIAELVSFSQQIVNA